MRAHPNQALRHDFRRADAAAHELRRNLKPQSSGQLGARPSSVPALHGLTGDAFVDDRAEREADRAADAAMGDRRETYRSGAAPSWGSSSGPAPADGRPLPGSVRSYLEPRLRHDFSRVRIHDDERGARLSRALGAAAFTFGDDVYFARGRFSPGDRAGIRLLAHELAHVAQQAATGVARVQRQPDDETVLRPPIWPIPRTGWYKGIENNPWGGLPEILYPDSPDDFQSLTAIDIDVDQMARIRFDAETMQSQSSGERRLPHASQWTSFFVRERAAGPGVPTLAELEAEHQRLREAVLLEIAGIKKPVLRGFLTDRIHAVLPVFGGPLGLRSLRRTESLPPPEYNHEERLMWVLLRSPSG